MIFHSTLPPLFKCPPPPSPHPVTLRKAWRKKWRRVRKVKVESLREKGRVWVRQGEEMKRVERVCFFLPVFPPSTSACDWGRKQCEGKGEEERKQSKTRDQQAQCFFSFNLELWACACMCFNVRVHAWVFVVLSLAHLLWTCRSGWKVSGGSAARNSKWVKGYFMYAVHSCVCRGVCVCAHPSTLRLLLPPPFSCWWGSLLVCFAGTVAPAESMDSISVLSFFPLSSICLLTQFSIPPTSLYLLEYRLFLSSNLYSPSIFYFLLSCSKSVLS